MSGDKRYIGCFRGEHFSSSGEWVDYVGDVPDVYERDGAVWVCSHCLDDPADERANWIKALAGDIPPQKTILPVEEWDAYEGNYPLECRECGDSLRPIKHPSTEAWLFRCRNPDCATLQDGDEEPVRGVPDE